MHQNLILRIQAASLLIVATLLVGCDDRVVDVAREAADRQAGQNTEMARLQQEVASGTHELVAADAQARQEVFQVHRDLGAERLELDASRDELEKERLRIAGERRTESLLVPLFESVGVVGVVIVVLGFSWHALVKARAEDPRDAELSELLVHELTTTGVLPSPSSALTLSANTKPLPGGSDPPSRMVPLN